MQFGGSKQFEIQHPVPEKGLLAHVTLVIAEVREDEYDADEIEAQIVPVSSYAGTPLAWQLAVRTLISLSPPEQAWDRYQNSYANIAEPGASLAAGSAAGLLTVADTANAPVRITKASFAHAPDARSGLATATFTRNQIASDVSNVIITFADGARESLEIDLANPNSGTSWRLVIGSINDQQRPPPAASSQP